MKVFSCVAETPTPIRVDRYISEIVLLMTRSQMKTRVSSISVNGKPAKPSKEVRSGDRICIEYGEPEAKAFLPEDIPLSVVYEDEKTIVVDKPQGMVTHPANGNWSGTLVNALLFRFSEKMAEFGEGDSRPGIVHRLDKDTSGLIIAAKDPEARNFLARQFRERKTKKEYLAIVRGHLAADRGRITTLLSRDPGDRKRFVVAEKGRLAVTDFRVISRFGPYSFVSLMPKTGRTHQLRVHLKHLGCPILGDPVYSKKDSGFPEFRLLLHAYRLEIVLPGNSEPNRFVAPLPARFKEALKALKAAYP